MVHIECHLIKTWNWDNKTNMTNMGWGTFKIRKKGGGVCAPGPRHHVNAFVVELETE